MIHQPLSGGVQGQATDIEIQSKEIDRIKDLMIEILSQHTGKDPEQIRANIERDNYMTAKKAVEYRIIDKVVKKQP